MISEAIEVLRSIKRLASMMRERMREMGAESDKQLCGED